MKIDFTCSAPVVETVTITLTREEAALLRDLVATGVQLYGFTDVKHKDFSRNLLAEMPVVHNI